MSKPSVQQLFITFKNIREKKKKMCFNQIREVIIYSTTVGLIREKRAVFFSLFFLMCDQITIQRSEEYTYGSDPINH